jgi:hypothetical protein
MRQNSITIIFIVLVIMLHSCIIPYEPNIKTGDINKFVVSGQVTDNAEYQTVSISTASPIGDPHNIPVSGCSVRIQDDRGDEFVMQESAEGLYRVRIDRSYLFPGASFKVDIITPGGIKIESDFDQMAECPDVDSVYFLRRDILSGEINQNAQAIQFYLDLDGGNTGTRFFRWELFETWEYHADYPKEWYYDGTVHHIYPPDYSKKVCWSTQLVKNVYTLSTQNLKENRYLMFPLNLVDNHTSRLKYGYSLLVNQFAMSEAGYSYWDQLRINSSEQGGLYEKQPLAIVGNLHNITNPDEEVLGFFSVSSVKSKRIFVRDVENLELDFLTFCAPAPLGFFGLREIEPDDYPAFLLGNKIEYFNIVLSIFCVDCTTLGGSTVKPDFWPY